MTANTNVHRQKTPARSITASTPSVFLVVRPDMRAVSMHSNITDALRASRGQPNFSIVASDDGRVYAYVSRSVTRAEACQRRLGPICRQWRARCEERHEAVQ